jgi:hypothetical protein
MIHPASRSDDVSICEAFSDVEPSVSKRWLMVAGTATD